VASDTQLLKNKKLFQNFISLHVHIMLILVQNFEAKHDRIWFTQKLKNVKNNNNDWSTLFKEI
jgi:hypothetical protein